MSEMHPSKVHPTMAHAPSSGLRLGFTDIKPTTNHDDDLPPIAQSTPTKVSVPQGDFTFRRVAQSAAGVALSTQAQSMMEDIRKEAEKYKDEIREREAEKEREEQAKRKIAKPTGKRDRFSEVHMAQFKKMDSIENHPSVLRAQKGRVPEPLKKGVKRSPSKANLDDIDPSRRSKEPTPTSTSTKAKHEDEESRSPAKRLRQNKEDDVSKGRAIIHDAASSIPKPKPAPTAAASALPRPKSVRKSIMSPTRSSLARSTGARTPVQQSLFKSPAKSIQSALPRPATASKLPTLKEEPLKNSAKQSEAQPKKPSEKPVEKQASKEIKQQIDTEMETNDEETHTPQQTPRADVKTPTSRIASAKSILKSTTTSIIKTKIPLPASFASKTPTSKTPTAPRTTDDTTTSAPLTTPGGRLAKHVAFTPETQRAAIGQALRSPSPVKLALSKSQPRKPLGEVYYPSLDAVLREEQLDRGLLYPDLPEETESRSAQKPSAVKQFTADSTTVEASTASDSFSFRTERTLNFESVPRPSFGASPGQATIRSVRPSLLPTVSESSMPGSFPDPEEEMSPVVLSNNKENEAPAEPPIYLALPHGLTTKKRNRVSTDEEELEMEERANKRQKQMPVPEGDALLAPRLTGAKADAKKPAGAAPAKSNTVRKSIAPASPRKSLAASRKSFAAGTRSSITRSTAAAAARKAATVSASATATAAAASKAKESHENAAKQPAKKLTLSRLEQLARPKTRK